MMRAAPLVALGIVAYAVFLAATVPARFVASRVERESRDRVHIRDAHGTLWQGAARVEVVTPSGSIPLEHVAWRFQPGQLMRGRVAAAVDAETNGLSARGVVARSMAAWHVNGGADASASFLEALNPLLAAWHPEGRFSVRSDDFSWTDREARGTVQAEWRDAAVALSQVRPLGTYRGTLRAEGPTAHAELATADGALRLSGQGEITFPDRFAFSGEARAQGPAANALEPLLDLLGPKRADGARALAWRAP